MDYKHYKQIPEGYEVKKTYGPLIILTIIFSLAGVLVIWAAMKSGEHKYYTYALIFFLLPVLMYMLGRSNKVVISPATKNVMAGGWKVKTYPFSEFLNFETLKLRTSIFFVQRKVFMCFNDNGKNKRVFLRVVFSRKAEEKLIEETKSLLS